MRSLSIGTTMLPIAKISLHRLRIPLKKPFVTSLGPNLQADNVVVIIRTADGLTGFGECSPFWTINGETAETCLSVGAHLAKAIIGHEATDIEGAHAVMDRLIFANNSIKSAFDIALHDIAAQAAGLPLWKFLGGKQCSDPSTDYTVSIGDPQQMAADAEDIVRNGFPVIKVKLGGDGDLDIRRIRAIRERVPSILPLRIDANQGWDPETAIRVLNTLGPLNIQHCEEPIPRWRFMDMRRVKEASPIPIMADESCCDHHDAQRLIELGACQRFNIKLGKSGGLFKAKKILALAEAAGMEVQIGGFLESRLAWSAAAALATTSLCAKYFDMDTPLMFQADPVEGGLAYGANGAVVLPKGIGVGASIGKSYRSGDQMIEVD
jgi:L-Ala-D/L-Glu epimerase